jgi:hypothetical protein
MARCPVVQLKPLSQLMHCVGNLVMVRLTQKCIGNVSLTYPP